MHEFEVGELIIYVNGDRYEIGKIKRLCNDGAFVYYHEGDTASKTPYDCMHKLTNAFCIASTSLGGELADVNNKLSKREREVLNTTLSQEIYKMHLHYGKPDKHDDAPERLQVLYHLRDQLCVNKEACVDAHNQRCVRD